MISNKLPINIDDLLSARTVESERIEFKESWNPETILHSICAFANDFHNLGGGYIVVGVAEKDGVAQLPPKGLTDNEIDHIQKKLMQMERNYIQPSYNTLTGVYDVSGKRILVIWAMGGEMRPYKAKKSLAKDEKSWLYYIRKHTSTVVATGEDEQELISLANKVPFDDRYRTTATLDDLEPYLIREFLNEIGSGLSKHAKALSVEELGKRMNIVSGVPEALFPKNVGLMFFNSQPEQFFPYTQIEFAHFPNGAGGQTFSEKIFKGSLGRIIKDCLSFIKNNHLQELVQKIPNQAEAKRIFNFPYEAIEEALVNAIYHRSYEIREPIEIRIDTNEMTILSYPGPDRSISLEQLQAGKAVSRRYRNRRIGEFLKELQLSEGRSTGIPTILRAMAQNGSPAPIFETDEDRSYFLIRLPIHQAFLLPNQDTDPVSDPVSDQDKQVKANKNQHLEKNNSLASIQVGIQDNNLTDPVNEQESDPVNEQVVLLLNALNNQEMGTKDLMESLDLLHRYTFKNNYIKPALTLGLIEMTIPDKPTSRNQKYRLTQAGKHLLTKLTRDAQ